MRKKWATRLKRLLYLTITTFLLLEVALRLFSTDQGHVLEVFGRYQIPQPRAISYWDSCAQSYADDSAYGQYDAELGWSLRPNTTSANGLYQTNGQGLRADQDYQLQADSGVYRIAVFGDSYTHGNEVRNDQTWPAAFERHLKAQDLNVEVMNFGVMSYGMDQALLRYRRDGAPFHPDLVLFGLQTENTFRNLNVFRPSYVLNAGIVLAKPRFVLEGDRLTQAPIELPEPATIVDEVIADFPASSLYAYEEFTDTRLTPDWLDHSYACLVIRHTWLKLTGGDRNRTDVEASENGKALASAILKQFKTEVEANGTDFQVVQILSQRDFEPLLSEGNLPYQRFLLDLNANGLPILQTETCFVDSAQESSYFQPHYTPLANDLIGHEVAKTHRPYHSRQTVASQTLAHCPIQFLSAGLSALANGSQKHTFEA